MAPTKDFYQVLGVSASASADEIRKAYRKLAKKYHPDANQGDAKAAERFKEISEANNVLGDPEKKKQYDEMRRLGAFGFGGGSPRGPRPGPSSGQRPGAAGAADAGSFRFEDFDVGGLGGLGDLFGSIFGNGRPGARSREPEQGQSVETNLEVPFTVAASGGKVQVDLEVTEECVTCNGSGAAPGARMPQCPECGGRGTISFGQGGFAVNRPCPMCLGRGVVPSQKCATCGGAGNVRTKKKVLIGVPAGAETGTRIRLKGQGGRGVNGGPPGDVFITFQVKADENWSREGLDLVTPVKLNIAQATLGSKVSVTTMDGKKVTLTIPPGTPSGKRFRVRGQGIAKAEKRGDLIIVAAIDVPQKLTPEQEKLMQSFADASGMTR